jgi:hypothetical protein
VEYADSAGADIVNSSLSYSVFDNMSDNHFYEELDGNTILVTKAADMAASKGMIIVNSAGNYAGSSWQYIGAPADADTILSVGAVDANGLYAGFSSTGPTADNRIKPEVAAQGAGTTLAYSLGGVFSGNGTSFSSPLIAGMTACLWQAHPGLSNIKILDAVKQSGSQYMNPDTLLGYGIPDFAAANQILANAEKEQPASDPISNIFPNPFSDHFTVVVHSEDTQNVVMEISDITGRMVYQSEQTLKRTGMHHFSIYELDNIAEGAYIFSLITKNGTFSKQIIKGLK